MNVDLKRYSLRTDLITDVTENKSIKGLNEKKYKEGKISVSNITIDENISKVINKTKGNYSTIYFDDITDSENFENVLKVFIKELKSMIKISNLDKMNKILVIGLGNIDVTPDALGPKVANSVTITKHIYDITNRLEKGYKITSSISPSVMGKTGIETSDIIEGVVEKTKPDYVIVIDALASTALNRVCKTIQITNTGVNPGSGIGNKRKELSKLTLNIPVIAIGVPVVVDAVTIVSDTLNYMTMQYTYVKNNKDTYKIKLKSMDSVNYLDESFKDNEDDKKYLLGAIGSLSEDEIKKLLYEVLSPIGYNLMVTPKEIDFQIEKLSKLISLTIDKVLHSN